MWQPTSQANRFSLQGLNHCPSTLAARVRPPHRPEAGFTGDHTPPTPAENGTWPVTPPSASTCSCLRTMGTKAPRRGQREAPSVTHKPPAPGAAGGSRVASGSKEAEGARPARPFLAEMRPEPRHA